jgi:putative DNA primase/helicase
MAGWRRTANSLEEFIHECCQTWDDGLSVRRSEFYSAYRDWCQENGRKPFAKGRVKELLEHNIGLGVRLTVLNGNEIFRGIALGHPPKMPFEETPLDTLEGDSDPVDVEIEPGEF